MPRTSLASREALSIGSSNVDGLKAQGMRVSPKEFLDSLPVEVSVALARGEHIPEIEERRLRESRWWETRGLLEVSQLPTRTGDAELETQFRRLRELAAPHEDELRVAP